MERLFLDIKKAGRADIAQDRISFEDIETARSEWSLLAPVISELFSEVRHTGGVIDSPLYPAKRLYGKLESEIADRVFLKGDHQLPIAGSIKARGGIYAVFQHAIALAEEKGIYLKGNYNWLLTDEARGLFEDYYLEVGSTGNLALSIGISGAALGFKVRVHMSDDAKEWKKKLLRSKGVEVIEYEGDYEKAIAAGRMESEKNPESIFIDDENSKLLFLGYSTAAFYLEKQLEGLRLLEGKIPPIFVYLPCGVGGAPGGITYGMKYLFGEKVFPLVVEPENSIAVSKALFGNKREYICSQKITGEILSASDGKTVADGLAVRKPSPLVMETAGNLFAGGYILDDTKILKSMALLFDLESLKVEPSAAAGITGPRLVNQVLKENNFNNLANEAIHIVWLTGGSMLPEKDWQNYYDLAKE
ncbi:MAG: D-serine ammonia-lyase [Bacillota bacterium]